VIGISYLGEKNIVKPIHRLHFSFNTKGTVNEVYIRYGVNQLY